MSGYSHFLSYSQQSHQSPLFGHNNNTKHTNSSHRWTRTQTHTRAHKIPHINWKIIRVLLRSIWCMQRSLTFFHITIERKHFASVDKHSRFISICRTNRIIIVWTLSFAFYVRGCRGPVLTVAIHCWRIFNATSNNINGQQFHCIARTPHKPCISNSSNGGGGGGSGNHSPSKCEQKKWMCEIIYVGNIKIVKWAFWCTLELVSSNENNAANKTHALKSAQRSTSSACCDANSISRLLYPVFVLLFFTTSLFFRRMRNCIRAEKKRWKNSCVSVEKVHSIRTGVD